MAGLPHVRRFRAAPLTFGPCSRTSGLRRNLSKSDQRLCRARIFIVRLRRIPRFFWTGLAEGVVRTGQIRTVCRFHQFEGCRAARATMANAEERFHTVSTPLSLLSGNNRVVTCSRDVLRHIDAFVCLPHGDILSCHGPRILRQLPATLSAITTPLFQFTSVLPVLDSATDRH